MKEFFEEFAYMCSSSNTKSRGLYIFIAIALIIMTIAVPVLTVMLIVNYVKYKVFSILWLVLLLFVLGVEIGIIVWLKKS